LAKLLWIALAGGAGSVARYVLGGWAQRATSANFPVGTMLVNVMGCLVIGFLTTAISDRLLVLREEVRVALAVGFVGGFTTFSAFTMESAALINEGKFLRAALNILLGVGLGLAAVWIGARIANGLA
jgi:CrcB protein